MNNSNNIIKYLHILKCPKDHSDLVIKDSNIKNNQIIDGELISKKDKNIYKIRNKIKFKLAYLYALSVYHVIPNFLKRNIVAKFIPFIIFQIKNGRFWTLLIALHLCTKVVIQKNKYTIFLRPIICIQLKIRIGVYRTLEKKIKISEK